MIDLDIFRPHDFRIPPVAEELRQDVRRFLAEQRERGGFVPRCNAWLEAHDPTFSRELGRRGWLGMTWPKAYGGHERSGLERFVVIEELLAAGAPVAAHWVADRQTGPTLLRYGTEQLKQRFLPAMARGEYCFAIGMSEPDSGSDLASVRTRAARVDGGWRITGTKVWTSHASRSDSFIALCRTGPRGDDRHGGLSQFIVDLRAPGVTINPIEMLNGHHHFDEVVLDAVEVPDDLVVGEVGNGWAQVNAELAHERSGPERLLSSFPLLVALLREIDPTAPAVAERIGELTAAVWSLRQMSQFIAWQLHQGKAPAIEAALVKDAGTTFERLLIEVVRLLAPVEPAEDAADHYSALLAQAVLTAPGFTLRGGTTEVLREIVGKGLVSA